MTDFIPVCARVICLSSLRQSFQCAMWNVLEVVHGFPVFPSSLLRLDMSCWVCVCDPASPFSVSLSTSKRNFFCFWTKLIQVAYMCTPWFLNWWLWDNTLTCLILFWARQKYNGISHGISSSYEKFHGSLFHNVRFCISVFAASCT